MRLGNPFPARLADAGHLPVTQVFFRDEPSDLAVHPGPAAAARLLIQAVSHEPET